jgi:LEA14-like dessication related protein
MMLAIALGAILLARVAVAAGPHEGAGSGGPTPSVGVELTSLELTALSEKRSEARAVLKIANPFPSRIRVGESRFVLWVNGREVGKGSSSSRTLRPHKTAAVEVALKVDRDAFLSALGGSFDAGMEIDAELSGTLGLRVPSGDLSIPLRLSGRMGTDGARSGVFALPEGGASLSPR